jgi:putative ABC transport system permease protein
MFKNFLLVAYRNMIRDKFYSLINITGLTVGILGCLLIALFVSDELQYDQFHENKDRIVRMVMDFKQGENLNHWPVTGTKPGPLFSRTFPEVQSYVRMFLGSRVIGYHEKIFAENRVLYADSTLFRIFTFPLIAGDPNTALNSPENIVITRSMAEKYFGTEDPLGKSLRLDGEKDYIITGIAENVPDQSQINFDFIIQFNTLVGKDNEEWFPANWYTYLLLENESSIEKVGRKIDEYMQNLDSEEIGLRTNGSATFLLEPLTRIHLHSELDAMVPNGNLTYIYILSAIAILILLVACINYTNLAVAQSSRRQKEMGMRKVLGARQAQLFQSFITEALLLAGVATIAAFVLANQLLPYFNNLSGKNLNQEALIQPAIIVLLVMLWIIVGVFSGFYPALLFSRLKLILGLRTNTGLKISGGQLGRTLIIFQFVVSIFLIIATLIIQQQRNFIQTKNLGYDKENVLVLPLDRQATPKYTMLKEALKLDPAVRQISAGYDLPTFIRWTNGIFATTETGEKNFTSKAIPVDLDFLETFGIEILAGSDFSEADLSELKASKEKEDGKAIFIINESAVRELGWTPDEAIGKTITCGREGIVKAVVRNFHIASLHNEITPLVIFLFDEFLNLMFIKIDGKDIPATLARLEDIWKQRVIERPFEYHFLNEDYDKLYQLEMKSARFISTFAGLAIVLACLGLFGLSAFMAVRRTKEIGIRKVLGASVSEITLLLSREFITIVTWAFLIAIPAGWFAASQWLQGFAYRIDMPLWTFGLAGIMALMIALISVSFQSVKAAMANPVNSLRNE